MQKETIICKHYTPQDHGFVKCVYKCSGGIKVPPWNKNIPSANKSAKLFYTWGRGEGAGDGPEAVELLSQDFPTAEAAAGPAVLLGSLDRADYLPPPAAAPAPTDVAHMSIGPPENAGYVTDHLHFLLEIKCVRWVMNNIDKQARDDTCEGLASSAATVRNLRNIPL